MHARHSQFMEQTDPLDATDETMRTQETALGHLVADAMRTLMGTDIAVWNSGAARSDAVSFTHALPVRSFAELHTAHSYPVQIHTGVFRRQDLRLLLPFASHVGVVNTTGSQVLEMLENSVARVPSLDGRFLQVGSCVAALKAYISTDEREPVAYRLVLSCRCRG